MHVAPPLRIMALDTTTPVQALATAEDSTLRGRLELRAGTPHAETLLVSVDRVLALSDTGQRYPERRHALIQRWRAQSAYTLQR